MSNCPDSVQWNLDIQRSPQYSKRFFFTPAIVKWLEKNFDTTNPWYSEQTLPVPWPFILRDWPKVFYV